jgi:hypothetical protein
MQEKLSYHFSYLNLAVDEEASRISKSNVANQKSYAVAINYIYPVVENFLLDSLIEFVKIKNSQGNSNFGDNYFTASLIGKFYQNWNLSLSSATHKSSVLTQSSIENRVLEISGGYEFSKTKAFDRLILQLGYKNLQTNFGNSLRNKRDSVGILLRYYKGF